MEREGAVEGGSKRREREGDSISLPRLNPNYWMMESYRLMDGQP